MKVVPAIPVISRNVDRLICNECCTGIYVIPRDVDRKFVINVVPGISVILQAV